MGLVAAEKEKEGIRLVRLKGQLVAGDAVAEFRSLCQRFQEQQQFNLVLDLEEVDYIDSSGLGALVYGYSTMKKAGGAMRLMNLNKRNIELLVLTKLETVFEIFTEEQQAVNSFFPGREIKKFDILEFLRSRKKDTSDEA